MAKVEKPLAQTIVRDEFTPALIALVASAYVWGGSRIYNHLFDLGSNEWRVISALSNEPGATAAEVCERLGMNKSIASRSINSLLPRGLIVMDTSGPTKKLYLTPEGAEMHDRIIPIALQREHIMQSSLSAGEVKQLRKLLLKMVDSFGDLQAFDNVLTRAKKS